MHWFDEHISRKEKLLRWNSNLEEFEQEILNLKSKLKEKEESFDAERNSLIKKN